MPNSIHNSEVSIFNIAIDDPWNYDWVEDLELRKILIRFNLCLYYLFGIEVIINTLQYKLPISPISPIAFPSF